MRETHVPVSQEPLATLPMCCIMGTLVMFLGEINSFEGEMIRGLESENENILVKSYKVEEVRNMLKKGKIKNGLTLIALQWFFLEYYKN